MHSERWPQPLRSPDDGSGSAENPEASLRKIGEFETWGDVFNECKRLVREGHLGAVGITPIEQFDENQYHGSPLDVFKGETKSETLDRLRANYSRFEGHQSGGFDIYHGYSKYAYDRDIKEGWIAVIVRYPNKRPRTNSVVTFKHLYEK